MGDVVVFGPRNFHRRSGGVDIGAEWRHPDCAAITGRFRVLDPGKDAIGEARDADGPGNAASRLLDIRADRPERRCVGARADNSAAIVWDSTASTAQPL